jgi:hypothetical protein
LALLAGAGCGVAVSAEPEPPEVELLEFLGSWEGDDEEWQKFFDSLPMIHDITSSDDVVDDRDEQNDEESGR